MVSATAKAEQSLRWAVVPAGRHAILSFESCNPYNPFKRSLIFGEPAHGQDTQQVGRTFAFVRL